MTFGTTFESDFICRTADNFTSKSMLDAYQHETTRIFDALNYSEEQRKIFSWGASCGILAVSDGRGATHDVYRAALHAAATCGHDIIPYIDTAVAKISGDIVSSGW